MDLISSEALAEDFIQTRLDFILQSRISFLLLFQIFAILVTPSDNPEFNELMDAFCGPDGLDAVRRIVDAKIASTPPVEPDTDEN